MRSNRQARLWYIALLVALLLACKIGPQPTLSPTTEPTPTATAQGQAQALPTWTVEATPSPTAAEPTATHTSSSQVTPSSTVPPSPTPAARPTLPPLPGDGPLPAVWTEIALRDTADGLNPLYPADVAVDADAGRAYVLCRCEARAQESPRACIATVDLATDRVLHTAIVPGSYYGKLALGDDALYLHAPWAGDLYALVPQTLMVSATYSDVHGIAYDGHGTTYVVTIAGLARLGADNDLPRPVERKYDDEPVEMIATADRVYVMGSLSLQVYDTNLDLLASISPGESSLRAMALDEEGGRLYLSTYDALHVLDTEALRLAEVPVSIEGAYELALDPTGQWLYALTSPPDWFGGTDLVAIDTRTWVTETLYTTTSGRLVGMHLDETRARLLTASATDHAFLPVDLASGPFDTFGRTGPARRVPIGAEVIEVVVDRAHDRVYATDSAGWIHVLHRRTYARLGRVYGGRHISLDATQGRLYAGDARLPVVTVFDAETLSIERTIPQPGKPRANPVSGEVVIVNRRLYVFDGASGAPGDDLLPAVGHPAPECTGCFYPIATEVTIDARRGLTATTTYMPWPGKPGPRESIAYDPASGRATYALLTGGYVHYSSIATYADLGQLQARAQPVLTLEGLSGHIALDPPARRLYVVRGRYLYVLDSETLNRVGRVDAVDWTPVIAALDDELGRLYTPRGGALVVWTRTGSAPPAPLPHERATVTRTVASILPSPNFAADGTLLATINTRLCRSIDGGETWQRLRGGLPDLGSYVPAVQAAFSPDYGQDGTMFFGAFLGETYGEGVYRSVDGGETWQRKSDGLYDLRVQRIVLSPRFARDNTLLAYARTPKGESVYRSSDRGETWQLVMRQTDYGQPPVPRPAALFSNVEHRPQYQCDYNGACQRSADGGETWADLDTGAYRMGHLVATALSPHFDRDETAYFLTENAVYRYNDRTRVAEICTTLSLYDPRDYTNSFAGMSTAATGDEHVLFIGSNDGEFLRFFPGDLDWGTVWPLPTPPPVAATPIPSPAMTASPTMTACAYALDERFQIDYTKLPARLGCAVSTAQETFVAFQPFERGLMFWRQDAGTIYVLRQDATSPAMMVWAGYPDTWDESQPTSDPGLTPPEGRIQPIRGFGKVWRERLGGAEAWIGWATAEERGIGTVVQYFTAGLLLKGENGTGYIFYDDGKWETTK